MVPRTGPGSRRALVGMVVGALVSLSVAGCGSTAPVVAGPSGGEPFTLPTGPTRWDANAPAWFHDGTLHVGEHAVELAPAGKVEQFVVGATGAYWTRGETLMFTSAEGQTQEVADVVWSNLAVSADHTVFATVDWSRGPVDDHGAHVMQVAAFDTRTGEQLYRTPDEEPDEGEDLAALYSELMPMLDGVSDERLFFGDATIDLADGTRTPMTTDGQGARVYVGAEDTLFPDGWRVAVRERRGRLELADSTVWGVGRLSPDRTTLFDLTRWPTPAVAYDASTGRARPIEAPFDHLVLGGFSDAETFFGVAQRIDETRGVDPVRARQVVRCTVATLACVPVSDVIATRDQDQGRVPALLLEGSAEFL